MSAVQIPEEFTVGVTNTVVPARTMWVASGLVLTIA